MKKRCFLLFLICGCLAVLMLLGGCSGTGDDTAGDNTDKINADSPFVFEDDANHAFSFSEAPKKVAVLFSSYAEIWQAAGGEVAVTIGEAIERGIVPDGTPLVDDGAGKTINTELLIAENPDFVICSADIAAQAECAALLQNAGIPAAAFRVESFSDYLRVLEIFSKLTQNEDAYAEHGLALQTQIDALLEASAQKAESGAAKRILFIRAATSARSTKAKRAEDHFAAAMLAELGCENIADQAEILLDGLSIEEIISQNPDMIFISMMGDEAAVRAYMDGVLTEDTWQTLDAVKNGRVFYLPKDLFQFKPNMRWYEAYLYLYSLLYEAK